MSNYIKYYTKRSNGSKATLWAYDLGSDRYHYKFESRDGGDNLSLREFIIYSELCQFLEANNFEEVDSVIKDYLTTDEASNDRVVNQSFTTEKVKLPEVGKRYKTRTGYLPDTIILEEVDNISEIVKFHTSGNPRIMSFHNFNLIFEELPNQEEIKESKNDLFTIDKIFNDPEYSKLLDCAKFVGDFFAIREINNWEFLNLKSRWNDKSTDDSNIPESNDRVEKPYTSSLMNLKWFLENITKEDLQAMDVKFHQSFYNQLYNASQFLVDVLEEAGERSAWKTPEKNPVRKGLTDKEKEDAVNELNKLSGELKSEKPKSIWKNVSELPDRMFSCFFKLKENNYIDMGTYEIWEHAEQKNIFRSKFYGIVKIDEVKEFCELTDYINNTEDRLKKLEGK